MAIIIMILSAFFLSMANLCMKRSIDLGGNAKLYLVLQFSLSILVSVFCNPIRTNSYSWDHHTAIVGIVCGFFFGGMIYAASRALEDGPPGLTFTAMNSATVTPGIIMGFLFGRSFGHPYNIFHFIGSILVIFGLLKAVSHQKDLSRNKRWLFFAASSFAMHVFVIVIMQWRALMMKANLPSSILLPFYIDESHSQWFMPMLFVSATIIHFSNYLKTSKDFRLNKRVLFYGFLGGLVNGIGIFLSVKSTEIALPWENAMIFPTFSVSLIFITNLWGQILYKEKIHWKANLLCITGIIIGNIHIMH